MKISTKKLISLYTKMKFIRLVEEEIAIRYENELMRCPTHLSIGQEAASVGVMAALNHKDLVVSSHRAHAHYLAKGGNLNMMISEIYGKSTGCCQGKGGSMHLIDKSVGFMGTTAIVANSIPLGVGLGLSLKLKHLNNISATFFGDGATEEGVFYESVNFAVVKKLPVLFVCENNFYSVYSPLSVRQPSNRKIFEMVNSLGIPSIEIDGNDVVEGYKKTKEAVKHIRKNNSPYFLELKTYRWREHCGPNFDNNLDYRTNKEFKKWVNKDPIKKLEKKLIIDKIISSDKINEIIYKILTEIKDSFDSAEQQKYPEESIAYSGIFSDSKFTL